jgi:hypothetical protein
MTLRCCGSLAHRVLLFAAAAAPGSQTASALTSGCRTSTKAGSRVAMRLRMTRRASTFSPICSRAASCSARQTSGGAIKASRRVISSLSALCNDRARSGRCSTRVITLDNSRDEATAPNARESERRARAPSAGSAAFTARRGTGAGPVLATGARGRSAVSPRWSASQHSLRGRSMRRMSMEDDNKIIKVYIGRAQMRL